MRIVDATGNELNSVYLALSEEEASALIDALSELRSASTGWHVHVSDSAYVSEVTVYREDDETAIQ